MNSPPPPNGCAAWNQKQIDDDKCENKELKNEIKELKSEIKELNNTINNPMNSPHHTPSECDDNNEYLFTNDYFFFLYF